VEKNRVLITDDHPLFRDGMHGLLDSVPETQVVGEATSSAEAIHTVRNHVTNIFSKPLVADRAQAILRVREAGLRFGKPEESRGG